VTRDSLGDDADQDLVAHLFAEIDAGRLSLDEAIAQHPRLERPLRDVASLQKFLLTTQDSTAPDAPTNLGEYAIVGVVGQGGMGVVYRARHERLGREVAVKTIHPAHVSTAARERFLREQKSLAQLHQTHIVPIYAAGSDGETEYFVMPYIEGAPLARVLAALRRGDARAVSKSDTLFSLVRSTTERSQAAESRTVISRNGHSRSASRHSALRQEVSVAATEPDEVAEPPTSMAYFRSAAEIVASAAEAIDHAHRRGVVHRDLKPNNIMLAADGRMWVIDFGLASFLPRENVDAGPALIGDPTLTQAAVGTLTYMAPEQFDLQAKADARTDVWGLGVTLYEMVTLRRAFAHRSSSEWKEAAAAAPPPHPTSAAPALPADLAAICWKAMRSEPAERYQAAGELAEDLRRWLRDEPVAARKRSLFEQAQRWVDKHRAWTALIGVLGVAVPAIFSLQYQAAAKARAELAEQRRQVIVHDLETLLRTDKPLGWSATAMKKIGEAAAIRKDATLEDAALGAFAGIDEDLITRIETRGASSAAYDPSGRRLVLGGTDARRNRPAQPAMIWDLGEAAPKPGKAEGAGLVAFQRDRTPIQLVADKDGRLRVLHVVTGARLREFAVPSTKPHHEPPTVAISSDGGPVGASFPETNETYIFVGNQPEPLRLAAGASAIGFSPDGSLVAVGSAAGETSIWSTLDGRRLLAFTLSPLTVQGVAFSGRTAVRDGKVDGEIAVGAYGRYGIVELATGRPTCFFETYEHSSKSLQFSPDGATIAADDLLFDAATGRRLLSHQGQMDVFAFSPDGSEICQAAAAGFTAPQIVRFAIKARRGVSLLHGLRTPASRFALSRDGRVLAALSRDWRVGTWDLDRERLLRLFDAPEGVLADNAAVALDADGRRLAIASGDAAVLWDVDSGRRLRDWPLPPGFSNELAFTAAGELILVRFELQSMEAYPSAREYPYPKYSRVVRGRNLLGPAPTKPLYEIAAFAMHCFGIAVTPDGERFLADGLAPSSSAPRGERSVRLFDARSGREIRRYPLTHEHDYRSVRADAAGAVMAFQQDVNPSRVRLIDARDGTPLGERIGGGDPVGPRGEWWFAECPGTNSRIHGLFRDGANEPTYRLAHFGVRGVSAFSKDGRRFVFETTSGAVGLLDLPLVEENLRRLGLR